MRQKLILTLMLTFMLSGCAISPPFNNRIDYMSLKEIKSSEIVIQDIKITWTPSTFPSEIEIKGASGFRGSAAQVRIPTGPSISSRLVEVLDQVVYTSDTSQNIVNINIINAESNFKFIAGILSDQAAIDWGEVNLTAEFSYKGEVWTETFHFVEDDSRIDGSSLTKPLEIVWDKTSLAMAKSIILNVNRIEKIQIKKL